MGCTPCAPCKPCKSCNKGKRTNRAIDSESKEQGSNQTVVGLRGKVKLMVGDADDFLTHHLQNQSGLSTFASSHKIRARQIIQHYMFSEINRTRDAGQVSSSKLTEFALKSWFQRTFLQALERAEKKFLSDKKPYEQVRAQLAEEYVFEIYQMGEFINAGFGRFSTIERHIQVPLSLVLLNSDSALYPLLGKLQDKYPLVTDVPNMKFPEVPKLEQRINVLKLFNSKCYADPEHLNIQALVDDLKFLIDEANDLRGDFKIDMQDLLGECLTDCKVKRKPDQQGLYKAEAVRRVFIKWSQTLIERIPEVYNHEEFIDFIRSKKRMADQFIFKGLVSPTTHKQVIGTLAELLESLKYQIGTTFPRQEFGLFIYDFLRCKTTRNTGQQVVKLLQNLMKTKKTKTGKRFQVVRIKNRFKWATRDLLINFRYGEHIIGQAQLCIDASHQSDDVARKIQFRHLLYELQRGLFGPTFEMIMLFQDASRTDIQVNMQAEGLVKKRIFGSEAAHPIKLSGRKCPQKHDMIQIVGYIFNDKITIESMDESNACDFCFKRFFYKNPYHYCYYCSIYYCLDCLPTYNKTDSKLIQFISTNHDQMRAVENQKQLQNICAEKKGTMVVFHRPGTSASVMFLDQIAYLLAAFISLGKTIPEICTVNVSKKGFEDVIKSLNIDRTPTTILFNSKMRPQVSVVGASFHDIESLFKVKDRIAKNQPKGLMLKCSVCQLQMMMKDKNSPQTTQKCQICMDTNKTQGLKDLVRVVFSQTKEFICKKGHVRCAFCSYLSSDSPSYYRDHTGRTYLSSKFTTQPSECSNGHDMQSAPQPKEYTCFNCKMNFRGNEDERISTCFKCKEYICIQCEQTDTQDYKEKHYRALLLKQVEIVTHFVQNRLEESYNCGCGKYFLKVYQSRRIQSSKRVDKSFKQLLDEGVLRWVCRICNQPQNKLKVHLACFYCTYAEEINGKPSHTQICITCALKSGLLNKAPRVKVIREQSELKCDRNHSIIVTSVRKGQELSYPCSYCKKVYYPCTERYQCQQCNIRICNQCEKHLSAVAVYKTTKKCDKSHDLVMERQAPKLEFCNVCSLYLQEGHFKCSSKCRYYLCLNCGKPPRQSQQIRLMV